MNSAPQRLRPAAVARNGGIAPRVVVALLAMLGVVAVMLLSSGQMSDLRVALPLLSHAMSWLEALPVPLDMDHVVFFALVAAGLRMLLPRVRARWLLLAMACLAVGTELLQFMTDGRTPNVEDARDDLIGSGIGLLVGSLPLWCAPRARGLLRTGDGALLAGVALLPLQQWPVWTLFGFPLMPSDLLFVAAIGLRAFTWVGGAAPVRWGGFHGWLAGYVLAMLLAVLVLSSPGTTQPAGTFVCTVPAPGAGAAMAKWLGVVYLAVLAAAVADAVGRAASPRGVLAAWLAGACVAALLAWVAIAGFYAGPPAREWVAPLLSHYGSLPPGPYPRVLSTFANANMFGLYLLLSLGVALAAREAGWIGARLFQGALALLAVAILATASPAVAASALLMGVWWFRSGAGSLRARRWGLGLGAVLAAVNLALLAVNPAAPFAAPSVRMQLWQQAWATWWSHPWRGVGLGQPPASLTYTAPDGMAQYLTDAHNIVLNLGAQGGVLAVLAFFGLCGWVLWKSRADPLMGPVWWAFVLAVSYLGVGNSFEDARVLWVAMGLLAASGPLAAIARARKMAAGGPPATDAAGMGSRKAIGDGLDQACARLLVGEATPVLEAAARHGPAAILERLRQHGVESLAYGRLLEARARADVDAQLLGGLAVRAREHAGRRLLWTREMGRIQAALDAARIPCVWLKGGALALWLYPRPEWRDLDDLDLLLPDHGMMLAAARALAPLGYRLPNPHVAGDLVVHELLAVNDRLRLELDLHWDICNDMLYAGRLAWPDLAARAQALPGPVPGARGLSPVDALFHAAVHRAVNHLSGRQDRLRWLYDVHLLAQHFSPPDWDCLTERAVRAGLAAATHDALAAALGMFGTRVDPAVLQELGRAGQGDATDPARLGNWWYFQWATLRSLPASARWRWLRQRIWPDWAHLRARYGHPETPVAALVWRRLGDGLTRLWRYGSRAS